MGQKGLIKETHVVFVKGYINLFICIYEISLRRISIVYSGPGAIGRGKVVVNVGEA